MANYGLKKIWIIIHLFKIFYIVKKKIKSVKYTYYLNIRLLTLYFFYLIIIYGYYLHIFIY